MDAVADRLVETWDSPAVRVATAPVDVEGLLPAVWPSALHGGGANSRDRPVTVRVVYVPNPAWPNSVLYPDLWAAVDVLDDAFARPLPGGIQTTSRAWSRDAVTIGDVTRDALAYDLTFTYGC